MNEIKNKADELVGKYSGMLYSEVDYSTVKRTYIAKQCALILCDEMLNVFYQFMPNDINKHFINYWQQVKTYIENNY